MNNETLQNEAASAAQAVQTERRAKMRKMWNTLLNAIMIVSGIFGVWLVNVLFHGRHVAVRFVIAAVYVAAIEGGLYLLRKGFAEVYETQKERITAIAGIVALFAVMVCNALAHFVWQDAGVITGWQAAFLHWGLVIVPFALLALGFYLQGLDPENKRRASERCVVGQLSEWRTEAKREALTHPAMIEAKQVIAGAVAKIEAKKAIDELIASYPEEYRGALRAEIEQRQAPQVVAQPQSFEPLVTLGKQKANGHAANAWQ